MSTPPIDPPVPPRKELTSAIVWTLGAVVVAILAFTQAADAGEKRNFYLIAGAIAVIAVLWNGYSAWLAYKMSKAPPAA
jgi:hypothetical protein